MATLHKEPYTATHCDRRTPPHAPKSPHAAHTAAHRRTLPHTGTAARRWDQRTAALTACPPPHTHPLPPSTPRPHLPSHPIFPRIRLSTLSSAPLPLILPPSSSPPINERLNLRIFPVTMTTMDYNRKFPLYPLVSVLFIFVIVVSRLF